MQIVSCPGCGAEVRFRSHAAVMAVCEYCNTRVLKDADSVRDLGKISAVLEDYSPIQIGSSGRLDERGFTVVGRTQLRYTDGLWNEWYLLFDDGAAGWLGDASGQYMVTQQAIEPGPLPPFKALTPNGQQLIAGISYTVSDVREAQCVGAQGELPFPVETGWTTHVADLRHTDKFLTLDYGDNEEPQLYTGRAGKLADFHFQLLREEDAILRSAGRYRGKLAALNCPSCGTAISYLPGMTATLVCQSCRSQIDAASPEAEVLAAGERAESVRHTVPLGAEGHLSGDALRIIGVMRRSDGEDSWTEYLMYSARDGFSWLVETDDGWFRAAVLDKWPEQDPSDLRAMRFGNLSFKHQYTYPAAVTFAAGAFNWRVKAGDSTAVSEYKHGNASLAMERTAEEVTWSLSVPLSDDQVRMAFKLPGGTRRKPGTLNVSNGYRDAAKKCLWMLLGLNAVPLMFSFSSALVYTAVAALAIYLPAIFLDSNDPS